MRRFDIRGLEDVYETATKNTGDIGYSLSAETDYLWDELKELESKTNLTTEEALNFLALAIESQKMGARVQMEQARLLALTLIGEEIGMQLDRIAGGLELIGKRLGEIADYGIASESLGEPIERIAEAIQGFRDTDE